MPSEPPVPPPAYSESEEEAKHPGAMLGLIMGIYPAIFIVGLLLAVGFLSLRNMAPSPPAVTKPADTEPVPNTPPKKGTNKKAALFDGSFRDIMFRSLHHSLSSRSISCPF